MAVVLVTGSRQPQSQASVLRSVRGFHSSGGESRAEFLRRSAKEREDRERISK